MSDLLENLKARILSMHGVFAPQKDYNVPEGLEDDHFELFCQGERRGPEWDKFYIYQDAQNLKGDMKKAVKAYHAEVLHG